MSEHVHVPDKELRPDGSDRCAICGEKFVSAPTPSARERLQACIAAADHLRTRCVLDDCTWDELRRLSREYDVAREALKPEDLA